MAAAAEQLGPETVPIPIDERVLTEVDHLIEHRLAGGIYPDFALKGVHTNLTTATQEAAMPFAVTRIEQEKVVDPETKRRTFMWLGKTAVQSAESGYKFHIHEAARARVPVEIDEARHAEDDLRPGIAKVLISPRMTHADATRYIALQEHLADDDAIRVSWLEGEDSGPQRRILESLLVRGVPLSAWVEMLEDPNNILGKSIPVENPESALSVMQIHRELEFSMDQLPEGPVSIVEAVVPYIQDKIARQKVERQVELFRCDQEELRRKAESIADRWLEFEVALAESLVAGQANFDIRRFIIGLQHNWGDEDLAVINRHELPNTRYRMSRELAKVLEKAKQNTLWAPAAVIVGNDEVIKQMKPGVADEIRRNEMQIQAAQRAGIDIRPLEAHNNRLVASQRVKVGGGCPGKNEGNFRNPLGGIKSLLNITEPEGVQSLNTQEHDDDEEDWKWHTGQCRVESCPTRPDETEVGPCNVCRLCQAKFDAGEDPTEEPAPQDDGDVIQLFGSMLPQVEHLELKLQEAA